VIKIAKNSFHFLQNRIPCVASSCSVHITSPSHGCEISHTLQPPELILESAQSGFADQISPLRPHEDTISFTLRLVLRYSQFLNLRTVLESSSLTKCSAIHIQNSKTGNFVSSNSQEIPRTITFKGLSKSAAWTILPAMKHSRSKNNLVIRFYVP
jgi:hypothetical protein